MRLKLVLRIAITLVITVTLARAQSQNAEEVLKQKLSPEAERAARDRTFQIRSEIAFLGRHPWAGEYHGSRVGHFTLAPKAGFVVERSECFGVCDRNFGPVSWDNGSIHLSFTYPNKDQGVSDFPEEFVPVPWGDRVYLIPPDDIVEFCNSVNSGDERSKHPIGEFLLRVGDEKKRVTGFPDVPAGFKSYLLPSPIRTEVVAVGKATTRPKSFDWNFIDIAVTLNAGEADGLRKGMKLYVISPKNHLDSVELTAVGEHQSEGTVTWMDRADHPPKVGWRFSTDPFDKPKRAKKK